MIYCHVKALYILKLKQLYLFIVQYIYINYATHCKVISTHKVIRPRRIFIKMCSRWSATVWNEVIDESTWGFPGVTATHSLQPWSFSSRINGRICRATFTLQFSDEDSSIYKMCIYIINMQSENYVIDFEEDKWNVLFVSIQ